MTPIRNALSAEATSAANVQKETRLIGRKGEKVDSAIGQLGLNQTDTTVVGVLGCLLLIVIQLDITRTKGSAHRQVLLSQAYSFSNGNLWESGGGGRFAEKEKASFSRHLEFVGVSICVDMIVDTKVCILG